MHDDFSRWLLHAQPEANAAFVELRSKGAKAAVRAFENATAGEVLDLVNLLYGERPGKEETESRFRKYFTRADPQFGTAGNKLEVSILSGAVLAELMQKAGFVSDIAALGIICADVHGHRPLKHTAPFVTLSLAYRRLRARHDGVLEPLEPVPDLALTEDPIGSQPAELEAWVTSLRDSVLTLNDHLSAISKHSRRVADVLLEESQIAWWLLGEYSRDLELPIVDLRPEQLPLLVAKELADLTVIPIGPAPARAILRRMMRVNPGVPEKMSLVTAVNSQDSSWRGKTVSSYRPGTRGVVLPVLTALAGSIEVDKDEDWLPQFKRATRIAPKAQWTSLDLAMQAYMECLLTRLTSVKSPEPLQK